MLLLLAKLKVAHSKCIGELDRSIDQGRRSGFFPDDHASVIQVGETYQVPTKKEASNICQRQKAKRLFARNRFETIGRLLHSIAQHC